MLGRKFESPLYEAVMLCVPTPSAAVLSVALPLVSDADPRFVEPSLKLTVPVGVPEPYGVTVAVNVTFCR